MLPTIFLWSSALYLLTACGSLGGVPDTSAVVRELENIELEPGKTSRAQIRDYLGEPLTNSDAWKVDIFRKSSHSTEFVPMFAPVLPVGTTVFFGYLLVVYDDEWLVADSDRAYVMDDPRFAPDYNLSASASARGFAFDVTHLGGFSLDWQRLLAPPELSQQQLNAPVLDGVCSLYLTVGGVSPEAILVDDELLSAMIGNAIRGAFLHLEVSPGVHNITAIRARPSGAIEQQIMCPSGESRYGVIEGQIESSGGALGSRRRYHGVIRVADRPGGHFSGLAMLLYFDGLWWSHRRLNVE